MARHSETEILPLLPILPEVSGYRELGSQDRIRQSQFCVVAQRLSIGCLEFALYHSLGMLP
jgi:hypothetical protein